MTGEDNDACESVKKEAIAFIHRCALRISIQGRTGFVVRIANCQIGVEKSHLQLSKSQWRPNQHKSHPMTAAAVVRTAKSGNLNGLMFA